MVQAKETEVKGEQNAQVPNGQPKRNDLKRSTAIESTPPCFYSVIFLLLEPVRSDVVDGAGAVAPLVDSFLVKGGVGSVSFVADLDTDVGIGRVLARVPALGVLGSVPMVSPRGFLCDQCVD
ncbi:hypothetical protein B0T14DRAFT_327509 [Immersiella caudata]|uniref:Uncharacterized protein n=1 Tax=Immersiella caudata TaxID=314043 RepID=A0AA39T1P0_9PEZI|nr:hypothetical protein B0T14DRAFT_327509 [Immersiella caudata]